MSRSSHADAQVRAALAAGRAAGSPALGQLVPVLLKSARSGSTWLGSILNEVSRRPFYLELRGTPGELQLDFVRAGVGFSTNPTGLNESQQEDPRHAWETFGRAVVGRAALIMLRRTNVVKHAISFLRVPQAQSECGAVKSAGCTALQPVAIDTTVLQEVLQCVYLHDHRLQTLARHVTAAGVPGLTLAYEEFQADGQRTSAKVAGLLRVPPARSRRLFLVTSKGWPNDAPTKTGTDDLSKVLLNFEEVALWLRNHSACLERQLRTTSHETPVCANPWSSEQYWSRRDWSGAPIRNPARCADTMLGFSRREHGHVSGAELEEQDY